MSEAEVLVVGGGAAGLMAAIHAGRAGCKSVTVLDGARRIGAKILIAGGGRCNVTHYQVDARAFAGSDRRSIDRVLRQFDVRRTIDFFRELGVELKQESTGKLFPVTDRAATVLSALLKAARDAHVQIVCSRRVENVHKLNDHFVVEGTWGSLQANRVILATGGRSVPETGSDGHGYKIAKELGHSVTPSIFPGLVPLTLPEKHFIRKLAGVSADASISLNTGNGRKIISFRNSVLLTHFGLSGPAILDISRYVIDARSRQEDAHLLIDWLPDIEKVLLQQQLIASALSTPVSFLRKTLPDRLAESLVDVSGVSRSVRLSQLKRDERNALIKNLKAFRVPVTGNRGFRYAEVTAGGVPLSELNLKTMESLIQPDLYLCGEICDVDGRIGGFNFQWAWASGVVAGRAAARI